ncbi:hypothetical protein PN36_21250 [Candidatus Thiomargarita nelsonii]|uniref:Uncharacterized protein n=1 Tax=Candidatus Thiomargarita nelsonii TaxID=1003181 RepID=A0A0A6RU00_9GAMM|nr:hypothetical protein PN36_21250 [Candidatus Thiomargarita nelsonii]
MNTENNQVTQLEIQLMKRLRESYPEQTHALNNEQLLIQVQNGIAASETIKITGEDDIFRFMTLPYVLSPAQQNSPLIKGVAIRILDNFEWSGKKRLNFIYKHLVNRSPSSDEIALSQLLILR